MASPVPAFLPLFRDLGLSQATIQAPTISPEQLGSLFWLNVLASGVVAFALVALAPVAAWFYDSPAAGHIIAASGVTVGISGIGIQHRAVLNRELRFGQLSAINRDDESVRTETGNRSRVRLVRRLADA